MFKKHILLETVFYPSHFQAKLAEECGVLVSLTAINRAIGHSITALSGSHGFLNVAMMTELLRNDFDMSV